MSLRRISKIVRVTARYRLDLLIDPRYLPWPLRLGFALSPLRLLPTPKLSRGERLRRTLEDLGPISIKFGQALSTRRDLLPPDIASELARLQDKVPPFDHRIAVATIEAALGKTVGRLFTQFDTEPLASASIAQVHAATLPSGRRVVVKVLRPDIDAVIRQDLALLFSVARFVHKYVPDGHRLRPMEVVSDYRQTVLDELDLQREAANTSQLRRNFDGSELLYVPEVFFDYTRRNVLVMERIDGIPISDVAAIRAQGTDMRALAERGVEIFFTQLFRDNFFHADMHPGNIFVSREHPRQPQYIGIDCAIIGSLSDSDRYYLARNLLAIFKRDYRQVARLHVECGWVPPYTRVQDFEAAIRSTCEPIFQKPLGEISFAQVLIYLFQTARRFDMEIQPSLVLLQKTLLNIEGLGRDLYPELDLWTTAEPYIEQWLRERYAPSGLYEQLRRHAPQWLEQLPRLPDLIFDSLRTTELRAQITAQREQIDTLQRRTAGERRRHRRHAVAGIATLAAVLLIWVPLPTAPLTAPEIASWFLLAAAAALWLGG